MLDGYAFRFDERASRPGRVVLQLGPSSTPDFVALDAAIFQATTRMGLDADQRDLLAITALPGMTLQPTLRVLGPALETQLLQALDRFTLVALAVGSTSRLTFRVIGNRLLLPRGDARRRSLSRISSNAEHSKIQLGSLLYLSGNRFLHTECIIRPILDLCGPLAIAFQFEEYQKVGGIGELERLSVISALLEEARTITGSTPSLLLFQVGAVDEPTRFPKFWLSAFMAQSGILVAAQSISRGNGKYQIIGSKLSHIAVDATISVRIDGQHTWISPCRVTEAPSDQRPEVAIANWLSP